MRIVDSVLMELEQEAKTTKRVLERVPEDKLGWKLHQKSMTLGQLAFHIATTPGSIAEMVVPDCCDLKPDAFKGPRTPSTKAEILEAFQQNLAAAREALNKLDDVAMSATWRLTIGGKDMLSVPRIGFIRSVMLNHSYHHRGQLSVYLRLLDVPVPSIHGPSADENPY